MSVGPMGTVGSAAGSPLSQTKGTDTERTQQETSNQARQVQSDKNAENAAGIGETEQDEQASERDADGRRLWEDTTGSKDEPSQQPDAESEGQGPAQQSLSRDVTGQRGNKLDLCG